MAQRVLLPLLPLLLPPLLLGACGARTPMDAGGDAAAAPLATPPPPGLPPRCVLERAAGPITIAPEFAVPGSSRLVVTPEGLRAFWRSDVGRDPAPNLRTRVVAPSGAPRGAIGTISTRTMTWGPRVSVKDAGWLTGYCARDGTEARFTSVQLGADVAPSGETIRAPQDRSCGASAPDVLWTGSHELFAFTTNSPARTGGLEVMVDVGDANGASQGARQLAPAGSVYAPPRFARGTGAIGLVAGLETEPGRARLGAFVLDDAGATRSGPALFTNPPGMTSPDSAALAPAADDTFLVVTTSVPAAHGLWVGRFGADGSISQDLTRLDGTDFAFDAIDLLASGTGHLAAAQIERAPDDNALAVFVLDESGWPTSTWQSPDSGGFEEGPSLAIRDDRVFVLYGWLGDAQTYEVRLVVLGCRA